VEKIIEHFGNKVGLANALNVDKSAVSQWLKDGLPAARAIEIEKLTEGKFKALDIVGLKVHE